MTSGPDIVSVKTILKTNEVNSQYLVNFEGSSLEEASKIQCDVYVDKTKKTDCAIIAKRRGVFHLGITETPKDSLCQNLLLIRKRNKKKVKLVPLSICNFKPIKKDSFSTSSNVDRELSYSNLASAFGSKRLKRSVALGKRMTSNPEASEKGLSDVASTITIEESDLTEADVDILDNINRILPPCDRNAAVIENVYKIDDIISPSERATLNDAAKYYMDTPPSEADEKSAFFIYHHYNLLGDKLTTEKMQLILYAHCLIMFFQARSQNVRGCMTDMNLFSAAIAQKIMNDFTVGKSVVPARLNDKLICYILVLVLIICDYKIHVDIVFSCLKGYHTKKLHTLLRCIGALRIDKQKNIYGLKFPLPPLPVCKKPLKKRR